MMKYAVLKNIENGNVFWTSIRGRTEEELTRLGDGNTVAYEVLSMHRNRQGAMESYTMEFHKSLFVLDV